MSSTFQRGLFHLVGGMTISVGALFMPRALLLVCVGAVTATFLAFEVLRLKIPIINRWFIAYFMPLLREKERSQLTSASYVLISSLIAFLAFERDIAVLALSFLAVGDSLATIVGKKFGKTKCLDKTWEGHLTCLISCIAIGVILHYIAVDIPLRTILVGSVIASLMEAVTLPVDDNLTIPLFAAGMMTLMHVLMPRMQ